MDWLKLFALLVAVATGLVSAEGPKKKIRIHLPQKVKHIHHHKKVYITNHPASSQYAPAYMPSAEGVLPTGMALPSVTSLLPVNSAEVYDEQRARLPGIAAAGSKILPLYRARGYYGPNPADWEDQEYDLAPPSESTDHSYVPTALSAPISHVRNYPQKKVKIINLNEPPRKKAVRKGKPKRNPVRPKPQSDEEIPVSTYHEQFYSDLDGSAIIRKVKKPQRVEKIIDGDTEHIHTYSEEHIHNLVYNDGTSKLVGIDPVGSMSALSASQSIFPIKHTLMALSPGALSGFATMGSMGTPSHLEYAAYNPRDVTHDHIFHDHGEIPPDADIPKENLPYPPRFSYNNNQAFRGAGFNTKIPKNNFPIPYTKPTRPTILNDYSFYDNTYSSYNKPRPASKLTSIPSYPTSSDSTISDYKPFKLRDKGNTKTRNIQPGLYFGSGKQTLDYHTQQTSAPAPFAVSSTIVHDYKPKNYLSQISGTGYNNNKNPLQNFKDNSYSNNFDFDSYASASNVFPSGDDDSAFVYHGKKGKKKSVSTQNIRIGGLDHQTTVDHLGDSGISMSINEGSPTAMDFDPTKTLDAATATAYTIRESSLAYPYYSAMAAKALHGDEVQVPEASNANFQYVEAPYASTTEFAPVATTSSPLSSNYVEQQSSDSIPTESVEYVIETRPKHRSKETKLNSRNVLKDARQRYSVLDLEVTNYESVDRPVASLQTDLQHDSRNLYHRSTESPETSGSRKYGDRL